MVWLIYTLVLLVLVSSLTHELLTGVTYVQVPPGTTNNFINSIITVSFRIWNVPQSSLPSKIYSIWSMYSSRRQLVVGPWKVTVACHSIIHTAAQCTLHKSTPCQAVTVHPCSSSILSALLIILLHSSYKALYPACLTTWSIFGSKNVSPQGW